MLIAAALASLMGNAIGMAQPQDCTSWLTFTTDCPGCAGASVNQTTFIEELGSPFTLGEGTSTRR